MKFIEQNKAIAELQKYSSNGESITPSSVLEDMIEDNLLSILGSNNIADKIFETWKNSGDKESVEEMFILFVGISFTDYLEQCLKMVTH